MIARAVRTNRGLVRGSRVPSLATARRSSRIWRWLPLLPVLLLATSATAAVMLTGFDGLYGQDSFAYFHYATGGLRASLLRWHLPPPFFWPPGYPLLVAAVSGVIGSVPLAGQIVSILGGAAVPGFTILLASELAFHEGREHQRAGLAAPLVAGLVVAVTGQLLQSSIVVMADTVGVAAATAGAWALVRYRRTSRGGWLALSAAAFAWAMVTRWIYALVALPFAAWALCRIARRPRPGLLHGAGAAAVGAVILAPVLVPAILGLMAGGNAPFAGDLQVYSWTPLNALRRVFETADGQLSYSLPNGLYYALAPGSWWYFGPILAAFVAPGLWSLLRHRVPPVAGLLLAWIAMVYAFHAGAPWQNPRFALAYLPPLAVLAALGFAELRAAGDVRIRRLAAIGLVSGLALAAVGSVVLTGRFIERKQGDVATVSWVERLAPSGTQLLTFGLTATLQEYSPIETLDLSEVSSSAIGQLLSDGRPTLVLVDVAGMERQWSGRPPWVNYRSLRDGPGLIPLGTRGVYTLFAVRPQAP